MGLRDWLPWGRKDDMAEENNEALEAQEDPGLTEEEVDELSFARLVQRGKVAQLLETAGLAPKPVQTARPTVPGTDIEVDDRWEQMSTDEKLAHVAKATREKLQAEADEKVERLRQEIHGTMAPVLKSQVVSAVQAQCSPEARGFVEQAVREAEQRFKRPITQLGENDAWLIAGKAEELAARAQRASAPQHVVGEGVPTTGSDPQVVEYMRRFNEVRPEKPIDYAKAKALLETQKENYIG